MENINLNTEEVVAPNAEEKYITVQLGEIDPNQPIWGKMGEWLVYKQYNKDEVNTEIV
jgi:hypothetical protein